MAEPLSPKMFPSQVLPDETQLCFNKAHFTRSDFNVERFMNLARRRAALKEIHNDLRVYLKSIQNSMIELINDDYADFVHLSSNLVSLKESIDAVDNDIKNAWNDFQSATKDAVDVAEQIETRCEELSRNRSAQHLIRNQIIFVTALERLARSLTTVPQPVTMLWLEQVTSAVVDATAFKGELVEGSREETAYNKIMSRCQVVLGEQAVVSLKGDCQILPLVLSVLSLCGCTDQLVSRIVSSVLVPKIGTVAKKTDAHTSLKGALGTIKSIRSEWADRLGSAWRGHVESFLDQTLLTFLITYLDEHLVTVLCPTIPADTKQFHRCFSLIAEFILEWPSASKHLALLKQLRTKFQLPMYFKMTTNAYAKRVNEAINPEKFQLRSEEEKSKDEDDEDSVECTTSAAVLEAIRSVWSEDVFLHPLTDKLWDFTLRMLQKHQAWTRAMIDHISSLKEDEFMGLRKWVVLLKIRSDATKVDQKVFDTALEVIWVKLRELGVDPSPFGQCLTKFSQLVKVECEKIDEMIKSTVAAQLKKDFDSVADVPKQYRWTKKPAPTSHSAYVIAAHAAGDAFERQAEESGFDGSEEIAKSILLDAYTHFVVKADQVIQTVEATGSSLSRFKKKEGSAAPEGDTDEGKIKAQIVFDAEECKRNAVEKGIEIPGVDDLLRRIRESSKETSA